jgi:hypothetical protein
MSAGLSCVIKNERPEGDAPGSQNCRYAGWSYGKLTEIAGTNLYGKGI